MCFALNDFATLSNERVDFSWGVNKPIKLFTESLRWLICLYINVTSKSLYFCDFFGPLLLLSTQSFEHKLFDIGLPEELHEEFRRPQYLWLHNNNQEPLIIDLSLDQLLRGIPTLRVVSRQRWNDSLRVLLQEVFSQCVEIVVGPWHLPLERVGHNLHLD